MVEILKNTTKNCGKFTTKSSINGSKKKPAQKTKKLMAEK